MKGHPNSAALIPYHNLNMSLAKKNTGYRRKGCAFLRPRLLRIVNYIKCIMKVPTIRSPRRSAVAIKRRWSPGVSESSSVISA
jgi:hypothetical protein